MVRIKIKFGMCILIPRTLLILMYIGDIIFYGINKLLYLMACRLKIFEALYDIVQGCHFSVDRRISAYLLLLWAADWLISLFLSEICFFCQLLVNNQLLHQSVAIFNIQSSSIHNINISNHLNLILFYSTI